jgi:predicted XRE-type DNA-binding protein
MIYYAIMKALQTPDNIKLSEQLEGLRLAIKSGIVTQDEISAATGVHQSQISRVLSGHVKRASKNVHKLCKYVDNMHNMDLTIDGLIDSRLYKAIKRVWDGSPEHAEAIAKVILSLDGMAVRDSPH